MARIRTLKPEILEDEKVAVLTDGAFRLFTSMIVLADDHGNVRADVRWLCGQVWWCHDDHPNVLGLLLELANAPLITVYGVRGGTYAHLLGWEKHQRIDNAGKNRVPLPNDADAQQIQLTANGNAVVSRNFAANLGETRLDPDPERDHDPDGELDRDAAARPRAAKTAKPKSAGISALPNDWSPRSEEREKAVGLGVDCDFEAEQFRDHHAAKGSRLSDWNAAFRTWLRNARKFADRDAAKQNTSQTGFDAVLRIANGEDR